MRQAYCSFVLGERQAGIAMLSDSLGEQSSMRRKRIGARSQSEPVPSCLILRDSNSIRYAVAKFEHTSRASEGQGRLAVLPCNGLAGRVLTNHTGEPRRCEPRRTTSGSLKGGAQSNLSCRLVCLRILACGS